MEVMDLAQDTVIIHEPVGPYDLVPLLKLVNDPNDKIRTAAIETLKLVPLPSAIKQSVTQLCSEIETRSEISPVQIEPFEPKFFMRVDDWLHSLSKGTTSDSEPDQTPPGHSGRIIIKLSTASPDASDIKENLARLADSYLLRLSEQFVLPNDDEINALKADPERASLAVTALFLHLVKEAKEQDQGYMTGNEIVNLVASLGPKFVPDVGALFEVYQMMHEELQPDREKWCRTKDDSIIFFGTPYLAVGWQLAWTISRAGAKRTLGTLGQRCVSPIESERFAALNLAADTLRYAPIDDVPLFGGGSGPSYIEAPGDERMELWSNLGETSSGYKVMTVFYGTDRNTTGRKDPANYYGGDRGERLELGTCTVSIPEKKTHATGELETPRVWKFEFHEDPAKHVVLLTLKPCDSEQQFTSALKDAVGSTNEKQALVFVHGYRVKFEDAARRTAQLAYDLGVEEAPIVPILYSWPSQGKFFSYDADEANATNAKSYLEKFLTLVANQSGAKVIHLIAHSMGNYALTNVLLQSTALSGEAGKPLFTEIVLTAPDIDAGSFKKDIAPKIKSQGKRVTLYASRRDWALWAAKMLRRGYLRAGDANHILVTTGIDTIDASAVDTSFTGHSYFGESRSVVSDITYLLHGISAGLRAGMTSVKHPDGRYWVFRP